MMMLNLTKKIVVTVSKITCFLLFSVFVLSLTACNSNKTGDLVVQKTWLDESVPSLYETYSDYLDYIGVAIPSHFLALSSIQSGVKKHYSSFTMENEMKPDFILGSNGVTVDSEFVASDGKRYKVPSKLNGLDNVKTFLSTAQKLGMTMRGHVLVWHSQTPTLFFRENFKNSGKYVDKDTMNARMEWYIKTVITYVQDWEKQNNNGKHILTAWDVVNEAAADGNYGPRVNGDWYKVYKSDEFIMNAFVYANKYADSDVLLAYNDYNSYQEPKTQTIYDFVEKIKATPGARIDIIGMQSHLGGYTDVYWPGTETYLTAAKKLASTGVKIQVTELDFQGSPASADAALTQEYYEFFKMYLENQDIFRGITFWGLKDDFSWRYNNGENNPLLFGENYICKNAFFKVIDAALEYKASH